MLRKIIIWNFKRTLHWVRYLRRLYTSILGMWVYVSKMLHKIFIWNFKRILHRMEYLRRLFKLALTMEDHVNRVVSKTLNMIED